MKQIKLASNKGIALVDDEDFEELSKYKWFVIRKLHNLYAYTTIVTNGQPKDVAMHRMIMDAQKGQQLDHINRNGLDNRKCNLRFCTHSQNQMNMESKTGGSKYKGVYWNKKREKWYSQIKINKKSQHLGSFDSEIEAAKAYDTKATGLFGEFANLNFPRKKAI